MATFNLTSNKDYIDIILTSSPSHIVESHCPDSPHDHPLDFEFQNPNVHIFNPADDIIYKGKLLPYFNPPCHQTGQDQTLHDHHPVIEEDDDDDLYYTITFVTCSNDEEVLNHDPSCPNDDKIKASKKPSSWIKKVKVVLVHKMKAMKSLIHLKPMCSGGFCDKISFKEQSKESFVVTKRCSSMSSTTTTYSYSSYSSMASSCSFDFDGIHKARFLRSCSDDDDDEIESSSIDTAVAYCKKSFKILNPSFGKDFDENMLVWLN